MASSSSLDVSLLRQLSAEQLGTLLRQLPGDKDLVLEATLMKALDKIAGMSLLKSYGVRKVFKLAKSASAESAGGAAQRVYLLPATLIDTKHVLDQVKALLQAASAGSGARTPQVCLVFVPKIVQAAVQLIEEEGLAGRVSVRPFTWELLPLDRDLLSLEWTNFFRQCFVHGDHSWLGGVAPALHRLQALFGTVANRVAVGSKAKGVLKQLEWLESRAPDHAHAHSEIGHLFVVDRDVDLASALLSPVTYEALLDEVFGVRGGVVDFAASPASAEHEKLRSVQLQISTQDKVFENIRFKHFASIFAYLSSHAKQLQQYQSQAAGMNVTQMKTFVQQNLKTLQNQSRAVSVHISASEVIQKEKGHLYQQLLPVEHDIVRGAKGVLAGAGAAGSYQDTLAFIDQAMCKLYPVDVVLRLLCLLSYCQNGVPRNDYQQLKQRFCQAYGFKHLSTLAALQEQGLFKVRSATREGFPVLAQKLDLLPKTNDQSDPQEDLGRHPSFVFNGIYEPFICKLVKHTLTQPNPVDTFSFLSDQAMFKLKQKTNAKVSLIFFVGGYTLAEVAALKTVQALTGHYFVVAGTCNVTGKSLVNSFIQ